MLARAVRDPMGLAKERLAAIGSLLGTASTPRDSLLALSELTRRYSGDAPTEPPDGSLAPYELRVFSQNGEDGILAELVRRFGAPSKTFVEFGAGAGAENNAAVLADVFGWQGLFIECAPRLHRLLDGKYRGNSRVEVQCAEVTPASVEGLLRIAHVPEDLDLLCIDVDGADLWIWRAITSWKARFVVIEYNGALDPNQSLVQPQDHSDPWDQSEFFGASLGALCALAADKGYRLVYTELTGNNAFFVRTDLQGSWPDPTAVPMRGPNHFLAARRHRPDPLHRSFTEYR